MKMRQSSIIELQKDDPLKRIQEEISEVTRREQELRELNTNHVFNGNGNNNNNNATIPITTTTIISTATSTSNVTESSTISNPSDMQHDDDSGISSSSSPINGTSANVKEVIVSRYIRSNTINPTSTKIQQHYYASAGAAPPPQKLTRAMSTPQIFIPTTSGNGSGGGIAFGRTFKINPSSQKGIMRRFIATRGKMVSSSNKKSDSNLITADLNRTILFAQSNTDELTPPIIERDENGRPLRKGYIPVEEKIQKELRDMKTRESELKQLRRNNLLRQSQPNLADTSSTQDFDSDLDNENEEEEEEHCYGPRTLRTSKSISELCDPIHTRDTPSPQLSQRDGSSSGGGSLVGTLRPAVSLAQLCDIDPEEISSSHQLIAQWENIIQKYQTQEVA